MNTLVNDFLKPEVEPEPYIARPEVMEYKKLENGTVYLEIYKTKNNLISFHFQTWVAWRDAGNEIRSHGWYVVEPKDTLLTDNVNDVKISAENSIELYGLVNNGEWIQNA